MYSLTSFFSPFRDPLHPVGESHCFIRETVYHCSRFVASIKQYLASKIFLCYGLGLEEVAPPRRRATERAKKAHEEGGQMLWHKQKV